MKTLQESIIGKRGAPMKFTKDMLKSGYIVKYRNSPYEEFGMYFSLEDIEKYQDNKTLVISHIITKLQHRNDMGVFITKQTYGKYPDWMPVSDYSKNLDCPDDHRYDIIEVYPIKIKPDFLTNNQLKDLVKDIDQIKINQ